MIFSYFNVAQPVGSCKVTIQSPQVERDDRGTIRRIRRIWSIQGEILADTQAEITTKLAALEAAYNRDGGDAILYLPNGTASYHALLSRNTMGGVRSGFVYYPDGEGVEYVNGRRWALELFADIPGVSQGGGQDLTSFTESVTITGDGGPRHAVIEVRQGAPVRQIVSERTPCRATQSGQATGYGRYPAPPPPIWPQFIVNPDSAITRNSPQQTGVGGAAELTLYTVAWNYQFESPGPLTGLPTQRTK